MDATCKSPTSNEGPFFCSMHSADGDMPHVSPRLGPLERLSIPMPTYPDPYQTGEQANVAMQAATLLHGTQKLQVHAYTHAAHAIAHARTGSCTVHTHAHASRLPRPGASMVCWPSLRLWPGWLRRPQQCVANPSSVAGTSSVHGDDWGAAGTAMTTFPVLDLMISLIVSSESCSDAAVRSSGSACSGLPSPPLSWLWSCTLK